MKKNIFITLLLFISSQLLVGQSKANIEEINSKLEQHTQSLQSIESDFEQVKHIDIFNEDVISKGTFLYHKDMKICLDYKTPSPYRMVIANNRLMTDMGGKRSVVTLKSNTMMNEMKAMISACMTGNLSAISSDFDLTYKENAEHYIITVKPRKSGVSNYIQRIEIYLAKKDMAVTRLTFYENEQDYTLYKFTNRRFNTLKNDDPRLAI